MAQSQSLLDALYCEEEHWEEDLFWEEEELTSLLSKEQQNHLYNHLETNPSLDFARREAIEWVLKVNAYYSFSALTAVLAVNYFDRFVLSFQIQREKPWMSQLAAVACLSLAAKVEETQVPLLLDLQVEETKYVFEAKTIQRMEILVLSTLQWRMNPVTPLSFLDHITRRLGFKNNLCWEFLRRCESLILCLVPGNFQISSTELRVCDSIDFSSGFLIIRFICLEPCFALDCQNQLLGKSRGLLQANPGIRIWAQTQIQQMQVWAWIDARKPKRRVVDVCFSSDSSNDSWAVAAAVASSLEPKKKKIWAQDFEAEDVLSSPR
ncbi:similar to CYCLIN D3;2 [Actinidia rufa]|uniref:Similar to CYCLIN D32 n=1 Tax=Actinidia rufa TaxID=165716 RepID=A0A7J0DIF2_9ERIC|nr:similar to CYCLIN D3;2 [Actinidia rufa]